VPWRWGARTQTSYVISGLPVPAASGFCASLVNSMASLPSFSTSQIQPDPNAGPGAPAAQNFSLNSANELVALVGEERGGRRQFHEGATRQNVEWDLLSLRTEHTELVFPALRK
jgi:hypothetical protein